MNGAYEKLVIFLKLFKNRPYHLSKYLLDNNALDKNFIKTLLNNKKIDNMLDSNVSIDFESIKDMNSFYSKLVDIEKLDNKTFEEIEQELNIKLNKLIQIENYEEAIILRDYMNRKNIKRK
jgi:hypothetical protein